MSRPNESLTTAADDSSNPGAASEQPAPVVIGSLFEAFLFGWRQLLRSRSRILQQEYLGIIRSQGIAIRDDVSLEEARERAIQIPSVAARFPSQHEVEKSESKMVLASRLFALWPVFWTSLLPLAGSIWWHFDRVAGFPQQNSMDKVITLALLLGLFVGGACLGLLIHLLLLRPFIGVVNWLLR